MTRKLACIILLFLRSHHVERDFLGVYNFLVAGGGSTLEVVVKVTVRLLTSAAVVVLVTTIPRGLEKSYIMRNIKSWVVQRNRKTKSILWPAYSTSLDYVYAKDFRLTRMIALIRRSTMASMEY
ncbi:PREDICTED: uncharacterized protein LOC105143799 [Acromyrmex echinatior]|uniref:uncharacterized protein LOC105143799 n=1 Tax=Acromyrmex echinatior TaxID=103372 RepID=UPI000580B7D5|nr:PREDICTED: uncharacterized protein LOC105143799 [Acromyrmex echinatior]